MAGDYSAYDFQEDDPYLLPGSTCLINLLSISNTSSLNQAEADITQVTLAELVRTPVKGSFDLTHLQEIHYRIFQDIYPFAGKLRTVDILKGGKLFLPFTLIETKANELFNELANKNYLQGLELKSFSERAGYYLGNINKIHAFREGNGRTQRVFIDQLAKQNGFYIEWQAISGEAMARACREARIEGGSYANLERLLFLHTNNMS